jgi:chaperone modulatory protein CbpM
MIGEDDLLDIVAGLERDELLAWVEHGWVTPLRRDSRLFYREIDVARVRLIVEFRRELHVGEDAMPMLLSLMDQVYGLRRELRLLAEAVGEQPESVRREIAVALERLRKG